MAGRLGQHRRLAVRPRVADATSPVLHAGGSRVERPTVHAPFWRTRSRAAPDRSPDLAPRRTRTRPPRAVCRYDRPTAECGCSLLPLDRVQNGPLAA